jgi:hypothetical protein
MYKITLIFGICFATLSHAQVGSDSDLYRTLYAKDSLLFNVGFNQCDIPVFERLVSEDLEFYHDQSGIMSGKATFITNTREGLCNMDYRAKRVLDDGTLQVFPLYNNGILYGAVQTGEHRFYALYTDQPEQLTSVARFTHVWLLQDGEWRLSRVLSYDHHAKE